MPRVFVTRQVLPQGIQALYQHATVRVWEEDRPVPRPILEEEFARCDAVLTMVTDKIDRDLIALNPHIKIISNYGVGYDNIDVATASEKRIPVGNTPNAVTEGTADIAFALLMAGARRISEAERFVRNGKWGAWHPQLLLGQDVWGATLGIIGFGRIGQAMAKRATGFDMRILYSGNPKPAEAQRVNAQHVALETLLRESDFVSVHTALTPQTYHFIGEKELRQMKPTAILINTARGGVVDPQALYHALRDGTIAYTGLDVTEPEPIPMDSPLLSLDNCVIVPHIGSATVKTRTDMGLAASANIIAVLNGERPRFCVNPHIYD
jgi:glyoxylate reductase